MAVKELKARILKLLREDEEFRYAVAGLIGLEDSIDMNPSSSSLEKT